MKRELSPSLLRRNRLEKASLSASIRAALNFYLPSCVSRPPAPHRWRHACSGCR